MYKIKNKAKNNYKQGGELHERLSGQQSEQAESESE